MAGDSCVSVVKIVIAHSSPDAVVVDFKTSLIRLSVVTSKSHVDWKFNTHNIKTWRHVVQQSQSSKTGWVAIWSERLSRDVCQDFNACLNLLYNTFRVPLKVDVVNVAVEVREVCIVLQRMYKTKINFAIYTNPICLLLSYNRKYF